MLRSIILWSEQEFANWIKNRIDKYGLVENQDYITFDNFINRGDSNLKSKSKEYALTIDCAKELSMVENQDYQVFNNFGENSKGGRP